MKSSLEIFDIDTGESTVVLQTDRLIEAPNWSRDGRFLIVNGDGRLYRVELDAPGLSEIDTGFARGGVGRTAYICSSSARRASPAS